MPGCPPSWAHILGLAAFPRSLRLECEREGAMANDISLAVGGGARRMTYAEIATVRGISVPSARRLVLRHRWLRQVGNDGIVRVTVPLEALENPKETAVPHVTVTDASMSHVTTPPIAQASDVTDPLIVTLSHAIDSLTEQLAIANVRAERAERRANKADEAEKQAADANQRADQAEERTADKDRVIEHLHEEIRFLYRLLAERRPWWRRWFW
jgi:hypothetical protein